MESPALLPKRLMAYIHDVGVRSLDHLADNVRPATTKEAAAAAPTALETLLGHWRAMTSEEKQRFVDRVVGSVVEVVAATALLPIGLKLWKKAAKSARKVIRKRSKALKESIRKVKKKRKAPVSS